MTTDDREVANPRRHSITPSPHHPTNQQTHPYQISGAEVWRWRQQALADAIAHDVPPSEVDWFLDALTEFDRLGLRLGTFQHTTIGLGIAWEDLRSRWQQRLLKRIPLQYLVGHTQWRQFQLTVSPAVLIPRPETELLIDLAIAATDTAPELRQGHWADLGTGSGAIALGLAHAFPDARVHGVDYSAVALAIAQQNIVRHRIARHRIDRHSVTPNTTLQKGIGPTYENHASPSIHHPISLHQGSWFSPWETTSTPHLQFSGIVSNPPYIPSEMVPTLQPEVAQHEPHLALDGGIDGLDCIRHLIQTAPTYLQPNGVLLFEMMAGQADEVLHLLQTQGSYHSIAIHSDLAGIDRFAIAHRLSP